MVCEDDDENATIHVWKWRSHHHGSGEYVVRIAHVWVVHPDIINDNTQSRRVMSSQSPLTTKILRKSARRV